MFAVTSFTAIITSLLTIHIAMALPSGGFNGASEVGEIIAAVLAFLFIVVLIILLSKSPFARTPVTASPNLILAAPAHFTPPRAGARVREESGTGSEEYLPQYEAAPPHYCSTTDVSTADTEGCSTMMSPVTTADVGQPDSRPPHESRGSLSSLEPQAPAEDVQYPPAVFKFRGAGIRPQR
ncbi:hypothetical protein CONPUDRAFT_73187 [Coniophora puteana RWD-64-598 SS2]|uniref:Uncharacterized protein n=1 Tax=Coniophora puteana (strain RWD-64-598) TaxID=741705 RepID=A0A5M3MQJ9_CONPW|nr:uncharacterized protein CONPUDRAFT_73187 [Coniophora puteana RWD-64-598 SS2]EIW81462.1 hypothetical protein CONPUDRAFT_73187 [Coniophora puteana RWD-64-598 SS2]